MKEYNESTESFEERYGSIADFATSDESAVPSGWLELPATTGSEDYTGTFYGSGTNTPDNRNYTYNYSTSWYGSLWIAYPLTSAHTTGEAKTSSWRFNPDIPQSYQVSVNANSYSSNYNAGSYARGHQIPNADRKCDETMNLHTYYVTNQTPQLQNKFNGSIWGNLEGAVRGLLNSADTVYVATGACYRKVGGNETVKYLSASSSSVTPQSLPVPNYYWKAILKVKRSGKKITSASAVGFWFEHKEYETGDNYTNYAVSVDQIEAWTGFDLFTNLPSTFESSAEANTSWSAFQGF